MGSAIQMNVPALDDVPASAWNVPPIFARVWLRAGRVTYGCGLRWFRSCRVRRFSRNPTVATSCTPCCYLYYRCSTDVSRSFQITDGDLLSYTSNFHENRLCVNPFSLQTFYIRSFINVFFFFFSSSSKFQYLDFSRSDGRQMRTRDSPCCAQNNSCCVWVAAM
jgi:hypothetical protein